MRGSEPGRTRGNHRDELGAKAIRPIPESPAGADSSLVALVPRRQPLAQTNGQFLLRARKCVGERLPERGVTGDDGCHEEGPTK
jgi:hypothetical protein